MENIVPVFFVVPSGTDKSPFQNWYNQPVHNLLWMVFLVDNLRALLFEPSCKLHLQFCQNEKQKFSVGL